MLSLILLYKLAPPALPQATLVIIAKAGGSEAAVLAIYSRQAAPAGGFSAKSAWLRCMAHWGKVQSHFKVADNASIVSL
jgi:hypothetical protein